MQTRRGSRRRRHGGVGVTSRKSATADMVMTTRAMMVTMATMADIVPRGTIYITIPISRPTATAPTTISSIPTSTSTRLAQ